MVPRLGTMGSNPVQPAAPRNGNLWFQGCGARVLTDSNHWGPAVLRNTNALRKTKRLFLHQISIFCRPIRQNKATPFTVHFFHVDHKTTVLRTSFAHTHTRIFHSGPLSRTKRLLSHNMCSCRSSMQWFCTNTLRFPKVGTNASQSWNHGLPARGTDGTFARLRHRTVNSCLHNTLREQEAEKLATEGLTFAKQEPL